MVAEEFINTFCKLVADDVKTFEKQLYKYSYKQKILINFIIRIFQQQELKFVSWSTLNRYLAWANAFIYFLYGYKELHNLVYEHITNRNAYWTYHYTDNKKTILVNNLVIYFIQFKVLFQKSTLYTATKSKFKQALDLNNITLQKANQQPYKAISSFIGSIVDTINDVEFEIFFKISILKLQHKEFSDLSVYNFTKIKQTNFFQRWLVFKIMMQCTKPKSLICPLHLLTHKVIWISSSGNEISNLNWEVMHLATTKNQSKKKKC